ncbi:hypothetical protein Nepgr_015590 [Nepenthes gracilis]|uniref:Uncharacterized protein n=1 Tax=Nepenthes gracilis TaxID=150966 RepID=A0AAD3SN80_NEPGR|nr:hypothetical protein Nepgr_015590 [Nepenthes gracilis]
MLAWIVRLGSPPFIKQNAWLFLNLAVSGGKRVPDDMALVLQMMVAESDRTRKQVMDFEVLVHHEWICDILRVSGKAISQIAANCWFYERLRGVEMQLQRN